MWETVKSWFKKNKEPDAAQAIVLHEFATTPPKFKNDREWTKRNAMVYLQKRFPDKTEKQCEALFNKWAPKE